MEDNAELGRRIARAYDAHRALGARVVETPQGRLVIDASKPGVWDCNHVQGVRAASAAEIEALFAAMERHYSHTRWRVVHTDGATPDIFLARLAFDDYQERFVTIQMALQSRARLPAAAPDLRLVETPAQWATLARLVRENHVEGLTTGGIELDADYTADVLAGYRARSAICRYYLVHEGEAARAYGSCAVLPGGLGMIEDVFTSAAHRRRGVGGAMIAALVERLRAQDCDEVFLGALAGEQAKGFYARLGFRPVALARMWVKEKA